jgi:hypothetical protein
MARRRLGPQHDITGDALFVTSSDTAWDVDRVNAEVTELRKGTKHEPRGVLVPLADDEDDPAHQHVFYRYIAGKTRYDLGAEGIGEYLDHDKRPEIFRIRRMAGRDRARVERLIRAGNAHEGFEWGALRGLFGLENGQGASSDLAALLEKREAKRSSGGKPIEDSDVIAAMERCDDQANEEAGTTARTVGWAVFVLSSGLTEEEKKA